MNVVLDDLMNAQGYKRGSVQFAPIATYIEPFVNKFANQSVVFDCKGQIPNELSVDNEGHDNITYSRGLVEAIYNDEISGHVPVVGFIYAFDKQKPELKTYFGYRYKTNDRGVHACMNLCVFGARNVFTIAATSNSTEEVYGRASRYLENIERESVEFQQTITSLKQTRYEGDTYHKKFGEIVMKSFNTNINSMVVTAGKSLINAKSPYFSVGTDGVISTSAFNLYNAITQRITDDNSFDKSPEKTLEVARLILN